ncbi:MAG: hypothetical protein WBB74_01065, partial [Gaiellaceae bacterium]
MRVLVPLALVAALATGITVWRLQSGRPARATMSVVTVARGDVVVSVGGVGRISEAKAATQIAIPGAAGGGAAAG